MIYPVLSYVYNTTLDPVRDHSTTYTHNRATETNTTSGRPHVRVGNWFHFHNRSSVGQTDQL